MKSLLFIFITFAVLLNVCYCQAPYPMLEPMNPYSNNNYGNAYDGKLDEERRLLEEQNRLQREQLMLEQRMLREQERILERESRILEKEAEHMYNDRPRLELQF